MSEAVEEATVRWLERRVADPRRTIKVIADLTISGAAALLAFFIVREVA